MVRQCRENDRHINFRVCWHAGGCERAGSSSLCLVKELNWVYLACGTPRDLQGPCCWSFLMGLKPLWGTTLSDIKDVTFAVIVPIWVVTKDDVSLLLCGKQVVNEGRED